MGSTKRLTITGKQPRSKRNATASALSLGQFRQRKIRPKKGRGSYAREGRPAMDVD